MKTDVYLKGFWPAKAGITHFWTLEQMMPVLHAAGWFQEIDTVVAQAAAICKAESGGDPGACLGYIDVPGSQTGSTWEKLIYNRNAAWLRKQSTALAYTQIQPMLNTRQLKIELPTRVLKLSHVDCGWFQVSQLYLKGVTVQEMLQPKLAAGYAYVQVYKAWNNTFNAWTKFGQDGWEKIYPEALKVVKQYRSKIATKKGSDNP